MYCDQSQIYPIAWQCLDAPKFCECYIHEFHAVCSSIFSPHSIEHSNNEACMPHTCTPNEMPAENKVLNVINSTINSKFLWSKCTYNGTHWSDFMEKKIAPVTSQMFQHEYNHQGSLR
jgi:hypothetical protein